LPASACKIDRLHDISYNNHTNSCILGGSYVYIGTV
jgi:hypothetical protein